MTKGANVGAQADLGLGPLTLTSNAGFETLRADDEVLGDFWYEPLPEGEVIVQPAQPVEEGQLPEDGSQFFGLQVRVQSCCAGIRRTSQCFREAWR